MNLASRVSRPAGQHTGLSSAKHAPSYSSSQFRTLQPCRVTNTNKEIYDYKGVKESDLINDCTYEDMVVHNPEAGRYEERVKKFYLDELFNKSPLSKPDLEETAYWFHTPPNGWVAESEALEPAEEISACFPAPIHLDAESPVYDLEEDTVITGTVTDVWWFHGAQIDFGNECDGLVPIYDDECFFLSFLSPVTPINLSYPSQVLSLLSSFPILPKLIYIIQSYWLQEGVREALQPGMEVTARVHKVRQPGLYRWPIQLELINQPEVAELLPHPDEYNATIDHGWAQEQGMSVEDVLEATGRVYDPPTYFTQNDQSEEADAFQEAMGWDGDFLNVPDEHPMEDVVFNEYSGRLDQMAADQMGNA
eukprot:gene20793-27622_t